MKLFGYVRDADEWIVAQVAAGRMVAATEVVERFGVTPTTAQRLIELAEIAAEPLYVPAAKKPGPEMQPGRKEALIGAAQARDLQRVKGR